MSRLEITAPDKAQLVIEGLYKDLERRIESSPPGLCPVDMTRAFLEMCHTHTCGKCVPCRVGLWQLKKPADRRYERRRNYGNIRPDGRTLCIIHGRS